MPRKTVAMLHLIKLCVGIETLDDLEKRQKARLAERKRKNLKPELVHITRQTPKRAAELLAGGSLYWVVKGQIAARQKLIALRPLVRDGVPHCGLVYDRKLIPVLRRARSAFQGWRYLEVKDAPADVQLGKGAKGLPEALQQELAALGLL